MKNWRHEIFYLLKMSEIRREYNFGSQKSFSIIKKKVFGIIEHKFRL